VQRLNGLEREDGCKHFSGFMNQQVALLRVWHERQAAVPRVRGVDGAMVSDWSLLQPLFERFWQQHGHVWANDHGKFAAQYMAYKAAIRG
jgi:hypothetical protein